jgi:hypothetical protein
MPTPHRNLLDGKGRGLLPRPALDLSRKTCHSAPGIPMHIAGGKTIFKANLPLTL